jgi:hypothetical protein
MKRNGFEQLQGQSLVLDTEKIKNNEETFI